jgi:hypothetical protein
VYNLIENNSIYRKMYKRGNLYKQTNSRINTTMTSLHEDIDTNTLYGSAYQQNLKISQQNMELEKKNQKLQIDNANVLVFPLIM